jgi:inositol 1,4,5-triphosphate receptor type 1
LCNCFEFRTELVYQLLSSFFDSLREFSLDYCCSNCLVNCNHFQLFDVVYREETLLNVIRSVTRNGRSIILTAVLALILVYMFSIIGYMFFRDDFLVSIDEEPGSPPCLPSPDGVNSQVTLSAEPPEICRAPVKGEVDVKESSDSDAKERSCDSLLMCIVTTMNQGLRNGGGIGDILRAPSSKVNFRYQNVDP